MIRVNRSPSKDRFMPCDLLADPAPRQVREMWGTGWDVRLVLGYVDLECWSWSLRLDPVTASPLPVSES